MRIYLHPDNPEKNKVAKITECLRDGGTIIYPTDTVYALGCNLYNKKAIDRLCQIKSIKPEKALFSVIVPDLSALSMLAKSVDTSVYRVLKAYTPGPFTFILPASKQVPAFFNRNRKTIGIRIPDNEICQNLLVALGDPLVSTTLPIQGDVELYTDPDAIYDQYEHIVDIIIDGGAGGSVPSTILDCTSDNISIVRQGKGIFNEN